MKKLLSTLYIALFLITNSCSVISGVQNATYDPITISIGATDAKSMDSFYVAMEGNPQNYVFWQSKYQVQEANIAALIFKETTRPNAATQLKLAVAIQDNFKSLEIKHSEYITLNAAQLQANQRIMQAYWKAWLKGELSTQ